MHNLTLNIIRFGVFTIFQSLYLQGISIQQLIKILSKSFSLEEEPFRCYFGLRKVNDHIFIDILAK
jgi:hypothetical protein